MRLLAADGNECWQRQNRKQQSDRQRKRRQRSAETYQHATERRAKDLLSTKPARPEAPWPLIYIIQHYTYGPFCNLAHVLATV